MIAAALSGLLKHPRVRIGIITLLLAGSGCALTAQQPASSSNTIQERIADEVRLIKTSTDLHLPDARVGYLWAVLAADYRKSGDFSASESAYMKALALQEHIPSASRNYATTLDNLAMLYLIYGRLDEAETCNRRAAKMRSLLGYPLDVARSEQHLAEINLAKHKFKAAENESAHALQAMTELIDPDPLDIISALNTLAFTRCVRGRCEQGMQDAQRSVALARRNFGTESMPAAHALMAVGFVSWKMGKLDEADQAMRAAIQTMKAQSGPANVLVLLALAEYHEYLKAVHRDTDAESIDKQLAETRSRDAFCATCVNVHSLSNTMK